VGVYICIEGKVSVPVKGKKTLIPAVAITFLFYFPYLYV